VLAVDTYLNSLKKRKKERKKRTSQRKMICMVHSVSSSKIFVACLLGNVTNNLWALDLTLDLLEFARGIKLIITLNLTLTTTVHNSEE
jgi:hypothetical protein